MWWLNVRPDYLHKIRVVFFKSDVPMIFNVIFRYYIRACKQSHWNFGGYYAVTMDRGLANIGHRLYGILCIQSEYENIGECFSFNHLLRYTKMWMYKCRYGYRKRFSFFASVIAALQMLKVVMSALYCYFSKILYMLVWELVYL